VSAGPDCPACGNADEKPLVLERAGYRLYDCAACGLGFCAPFRNPGPEYYEHNKDVYSVVVEERPDPMSFEYGEALALLRRELRPGARLLDVGCGAGGFLHALRDAGFAASGLDFNPERVAALRARGFEVFEGGLPDFAKEGRPPFDAVTMFQVLEHVDDIGGWLAAAGAAVKPGGLFIVGVPNRSRTFDPFHGPGLEDLDWPPHHLTRWNARALSGALSRAGFEVLDCRPLGHTLPLLQLMTRNSLRLGLATRSLGVAQMRHVPAAGAAPPRARAVRALVDAKEAVLNTAVRAGFPLFRLVERALGWQGVVLFAAARKPR
jgi:SAM-dependent methyltransferase